MSALEAAFRYAQRGWKVIPVDPATKEPARWNGRQLGIRSATDDPELIKRWFTDMPDAGVAIVCRASGLVVIDVDQRHGGDVGAIDRLIGDIPTFTMDTPDGMHRYYQDPGLPKLRGKLDPGRFPGHDIKLDGYCIAGPTVRADGGRYAVLTDYDPAPMPDELIAECRLPERPPSSNGSDPIDADALGVPPVRELLSSAGWALHSEHGEETWWTRPGKDIAEGVSAVHNHHGTDTLKVFTTASTLPSDDGTLTRFGVYAHLHHGGDFRAARAALEPASSAPRHHASSANGGDGNTAAGISDDEPSPYLPDDFWKAMPILGRIRDGAYRRQRSPDAVLHACLARVAAMADYTLRIPPIVGADAALSYFCALFSIPGVGKSSPVDVACELLPATDELIGPIPLGSGQGIVDVMFETIIEGEGKKAQKVKQQTKHNVFVYADEGDALGALSSNTNSTLEPTLRSIWTGATIGDTNATLERRRVTPKGSYSYGLVLACQAPSAGALLATVATGLPQRFGWALALHPDIPLATGRPEALDPLGWNPPAWRRIVVADEITDEIRKNDHARVTGTITAEPLDAHADLLKLKIADVLAFLDTTTPDKIILEVVDKHWALAAMVKRASDAARAVAIKESKAHTASVEDATAQRLGRRQATAADVVEAHRLTKTVDVARLIATKVWDQPDPWAGSALRRAVPHRDRGYYPDALKHAEGEEWVNVTEETSNTGGPKQTVSQGTRRPT
jgi:hypothetical protein